MNEHAYSINGSYFLTSTAANEFSYFDNTHKYTYFTSGLIDVLKKGVEDTREMISLYDIFMACKSELKFYGLPEPKEKNDLNLPSEKFYISANPNFSLEKLIKKLKITAETNNIDDVLVEIDILSNNFPHNKALEQMRIELVSKRNFKKLIHDGNEFFYKGKYEEAIKKYVLAQRLRKLDEVTIDNLNIARHGIENKGKKQSSNYFFYIFFTLFFAILFFVVKRYISSTSKIDSIVTDVKDSTRFYLNLADSEFIHGNINIATGIYEKHIDSLVLQQALRIAYIYDSGNSRYSIPKDTVKSLRYFIICAEKGDLFSIKKKVCQYYYDHKKYDSTRYWFSKIINKNDSAILYIAWMFDYEGKMDSAKKWYKLAHEKGL